MAASLGRSLLYTSVIASSPDRHHQGISDLPGRYPCTHRPADETAGEENDDGGHLEPALSRPDVGEAIHLRLGATLRSCGRAHYRFGRRWRPIKPSYAPAALDCVRERSDGGADLRSRHQGEIGGSPASRCPNERRHLVARCGLTAAGVAKKSCRPTEPCRARFAHFIGCLARRPWRQRFSSGTAPRGLLCFGPRLRTGCAMGPRP